VKPGFTYGAMDEFGCSAMENRVHVYDLHATIPRLNGAGSRKANLPLQRPRLPPHRRPRQSHPRHHRVDKTHRLAKRMVYFFGTSRMATPPCLPNSALKTEVAVTSRFSMPTLVRVFTEWSSR